MFKSVVSHAKPSPGVAGTMFENDPEYFENVARDKYGLLKENEMVFEFAPSKKENKK